MKYNITYKCIVHNIHINISYKMYFIFIFYFIIFLIWFYKIYILFKNHIKYIL